MPLPFKRTGLHPGDRICAAVSGGADSVALLLSLHQANQARLEPLGIGLTAAHVHHGIRGDEADGDLAFVQALCARLAVPLHVHRANVPHLVSQTGRSTEDAARTLRYSFFKSLISSGEANSVLTAHTLDDQAETVLLKLMRGAWTEGLGAIHPVLDVPGGKVLRPLLGLRRPSIETFLRDCGQPWRQDSSNAETIYTRNRVRHQLMPLLREFNPAIDETFANLAELSRDDEAYWKGTIARLLPGLLLPGRPVRGGGRAVGTLPGHAETAMELERLRTLDPATRRRVLRAAARQLGSRLSFAETTRLMSMCEAHGGAGTLHLGGNLRAKRSPRELRLFVDSRDATE